MHDSPQDAKGIFLAALDIADATERAAFVERSCGDDAAVRQRVEDLLRAYGQSGGPLDKLAAALASTKIAEPIPEQAGATIGPYKLMEQIGEGGFGLVFVAEQQQPIRRKVALKIIKPGMDTRDVIARFEAERQALALMDHPNIARVLDAGTTQSGHPYFVMELVRGIPITEYCDKHQLTPRERLELFVPVCNAIQHAHLKGIIHRDIKPSNVLVTLHDGKPVVKVIDFGVAKALHQPLTDRTIYTRFAQMIGTPLYMSPEQAEMSGLDIDTRTDVYSLGVLSYELLTGMTPIDKKRLAKAAYDELLKIIREEDPPKPSLRLNQSSDSLPSIAALRKTEPAKLSKMFRGDLDWIAMKALEKDRTRRYETANALAADVLRYLSDEPIEACPPSTAYRLRKFARKHRNPVIVLAATMAVLVVGVTGTTWALFKAQQAERHADESEKRAVDALDQATQERDAKEEARIAEARERKQVERELAIGLLRPIGFYNAPSDRAELRSIVDWSAIEDSSLKLRVLEIAMENPESALRVARRGERVIQACVGLSRTRRAQAISLVTGKQRDLTIDPRIRVAACWLALELGSADLPAWGESCNYVGDPNDRFYDGDGSDRFAEFVARAARRDDPRQIAQMNLEPLIAILEASTNEHRLVKACNALAELAQQTSPIQAKRGGDALLGILEKPGGDARYAEAAKSICAMVPRLLSSQVDRAANALIATLEKSTHRNLLNDGNAASTVNAADGALTALAPRLDQAQAERAWNVLIAMPRNLYGFDATSKAMVSVALRLDDARAKRAGETLIVILERPKESSNFDAPFEGLIALAPRLQAMQAKRGWDALLATRPPNPVGTAREFSALASRLDEAQFTRARDALIAILERPKDNNVLVLAIEGLIALAPRLGSAETKRVGDAFIATLDKSTDYAARSAALRGAAALGSRLEPAQAKRAWQTLISMKWRLDGMGGGMARQSPSSVSAALALRLEEAEVARALEARIASLERPNDHNAVDSASEELMALLPRLRPAQAERLENSLVTILQTSQNYNARSVASNGLCSLAPQLEPAEAERLGDGLLAMLENPKNSNHTFVIQGLIALAPRLGPAAAERAASTLIANLEKAPQRDDTSAYNALVALAPRLELRSQDRLSTDGTCCFLDYCAFLGVDVGTGLPQDATAQPVRISATISSPRSLAVLLSHPGCIGGQQAFLLQRFEEILFHNGQPVFSSPGAVGSVQAADNQAGRRQFHGLPDAAAWIEVNWPDFDLETNCPATRPGGTHLHRSKALPGFSGRGSASRSSGASGSVAASGSAP